MLSNIASYGIIRPLLVGATMAGLSNKTIAKPTLKSPNTPIAHSPQKAQPQIAESRTSTHHQNALTTTSPSLFALPSMHHKLAHTH
jgi:hypothetical protein